MMGIYRVTKFKVALSILLVVLLSVALLFLLDRQYPVPRPTSFSTVVLADNGEVLRAFSNNRQQWRYPIANDAVPKHYLELLLGYEDRWFYWHLGVNPLAIIRAAWQNLRAGEVVSGGSTLTMQVARLLAPHPRTLVGKVQQLLRAFQLEWHLTKAQILNLYLNLAPFGGTLIGVQAASISYFDRSLDQLSDAEAALLAVLPQAPSRWRPDRYPEAAQAAKNKVLRRMAALGIWSNDRVNDALQEPIFHVDQQTPMLAPLLARRLKRSCRSCERIDSFIDIELQRQLEALVSDYATTLRTGLSVSILVMENSTGAVRSYLGSADFLNAHRFGHVDMVQAVRSPGSTLKPFLYGLAIDKGLIHSHSLLQDSPRYTAYRPKNFSGGFNGPVSVTQSLQRSLNVPAVQVLEKLQPAYFAAKLQSAGLKLKGPGAQQPNESMILGGVGTKLEDLVRAYSAIARSGISIQPRLTKEQPRVERFLLSEGAAWITWKMLAVDPQQSTFTKSVDDTWKMAWKTGTSYGYREAWAMGVSKQWTIGVWVGRPDSSASPGVSGRTSAAPLLFKVGEILGAKEALPKPDSVSQQRVCWPLGSRAQLAVNNSLNCQQKHRAWVLDNTVPMTISDQPLIRKLWYNAVGERVTPRCDGSRLTSRIVARWPIELEPWLSAEQKQNQRFGAVSKACQQFLHERERIKISSVAEQSVYQYNPLGLNLQLKALGGGKHRYWYLNGGYLAETGADQVYNMTVRTKGRFQIAVVDEQGNSDVVEMSVE